MHRPPCRTSSAVRLTGKALSFAKGIDYIAEPRGWDTQALLCLAHRPPAGGAGYAEISTELPGLFAQDHADRLACALRDFRNNAVCLVRHRRLQRP